jgi:hypothetical protein
MELIAEVKVLIVQAFGLHQLSLFFVGCLMKF